MVITTLLVRRRERAAKAWLTARRLAETLFNADAYRDMVRARRRLRHADALLDRWTRNGTRR